MFWVERRIWYTWKCKHYAPDIPEDRIEWCTEATARHSPCPNPTPTTKASSRGFAARNECPNCRSSKKKPPSHPKKDDEAGAGGTGSATTSQSTHIRVGA